ncbi:PD-(D/E)XK nuclease-like domain-containing protein [Arthrobacter sp. NPDC056886]|uniref:PD-(D/E)XK nuclease-like domain-containing protein n=1 Tax=Arthrobacter sp. NPDC056886 TaxID=3345960 RepID=UPI00366A7C35
MTVTTTGIYDGITNAAYHRDPALGSTSLKTLATKTPAHYQHDLTHPKSSDAFTLGTAAHSWILEDDISNIVVVTADSWLTKAAKELKAAALAEGKQPLLSKEWTQVSAMRDAVMDHPVAGKLFSGHKAEQSVFWDEDGLALKCRPDAWKPGLLVDLKTTIDADPNEFGKTAAKFGYHQSAAHYIDGVKEATGEELPFHFVLVEKTAPYLVSVVELDDEAVTIGRALNDRAKRIYRECTESNTWPGYPTAEPISLPLWAIYKSEDILGIVHDIEMEL